MLCSLKQLFSLKVILLSWRHLAIHGEIFGCHSSVRAADICRLEVRNAARPPIMIGMAIHNSKFIWSKMSVGLRLRDPIFKEIMIC